MKPEKIAAIILIIAAGIAGSYFIVKNSMPQIGGVGEELLSEENKSLIKNPVQWVEENVLSVINSISGGNQTAQAEENLTKSFSQMIFEQIKEKNQEGLTKKDGETAISAPNEEVLSQELLDEFLSKNSSGEATSPYHPRVDESKFKISQDVSSENQIQYLKNLENTTQKYLDGFDKTDVGVLNEIVENSDPSSAHELANLYETMASDYYQIIIPANWVDFHKALLSHFYSANSLWKAIADFEEDPLRAYLASQLISNLEESAQGVQILMAKGISENNLSF